MGGSIVVVGSFVVDFTGRTNGFPLPGQTILGKSFRMGAGGKGSNQAVAAYRAGANVTLVTKVGTDMLSKVAMEFYRQEGMCTNYVMKDEEHGTGLALILVDENSSQNEIVIVPGACNHISQIEIENCRSLIETAEILLLQHEINMDAQETAINIAHRSNVKIVLNPAPAVLIPDHILCKIDTITPNETEAFVLTGIEVNSLETAEKAAQVFLKKGVKNVVITMGDLGAYATDGRKSELLPRITVDAVDTTGAGDAFNGGFVTALSEGKNLFEALRYGNATGALAVTKMGTAPAMPYREAIEEMVKKHYFH